MKTHPPRARAAAAVAGRTPGAAGAARRRREEGAPSGWDRYLTLLEEERIPESARRWYMVRAQAFVEAMRPKRLGELTAEEIKAFFPRYAREQRLSDWQYRQTVEAVRLLLVPLGGCRAIKGSEPFLCRCNTWGGATCRTSTIAIDAAARCGRGASSRA
jgi:hypothetical protein